MADLVTGEEPGEGGEGRHDPHEGDHGLLHVTVEEEDGSSLEPVDASHSNP